MIYGGMRRNTFRQPNVSANDTIVADNGVAAQDGGTCIQDHPILNGRVTLGIGKQLLDAEPPRVTP